MAKGLTQYAMRKSPASGKEKMSPDSGNSGNRVPSCAPPHARLQPCGSADRQEDGARQFCSQPPAKERNMVGVLVADPEFRGISSVR